MAAALNEVLNPARFDTEPNLSLSSRTAKTLVERVYQLFGEM